MSLKYKAARGTRDLWGQEISCLQKMQATAHKIFKNYHYQELRTPIFEQTELFTQSIGNTTDIVSKEMYTFLDKKGRSLTLRPEGTAGIIRSYIENNFANITPFSKFYYFGPMFRYERPQAGRYRQFHQIGAEVIGLESPFVDAELISMVFYFLSELGINDLQVLVNSVGCQVCRPVIKEQLKTFLQNNLQYLCSDCKNRYDKNILRVLDCKKVNCRKFFEHLPNPHVVLCRECVDHQHSVLEGLDALGIQYQLTSSLVRGLDYYTKTVFEIQSNILGAQNAICGGGRYNNLIQQLGGGKVPAVGFALGVERLTALLMNQQKQEESREGLLDLYIITLSHTARLKGMQLGERLRKKEVQVEISYQNTSLKNQLKQANKLKAKKVLLIGEDELKEKVVILKDMQKNEQKKVAAQINAIYEEL